MNSRFDKALAARGLPPPTAAGVTTLQFNMGYRCNLACKHCHVNGGPGHAEAADEDTVDMVLAVLGRSPSITTLDITGGAPELNPRLRRVIDGALACGKHVIVRTNLVVFFEPDMEDMPVFYADRGVELAASLPYYLGDDVDRMRGNGVFEKSLAALRALNGLGYATTDRLLLTLVYNPQGAFLPPPQSELEQDYRKELSSRFGIAFSKLSVLANMPVGRFKAFLDRTGQYERYLSRLADAFNPDALCGIMCRHLVSVDCTGSIHDCDFNLALDMPVSASTSRHIDSFDLAGLSGRLISTGDHCLACVAGQGST